MSIAEVCIAWVVAVGKGRFRRTPTGRVYRLRGECEAIVRVVKCPYCHAQFYDALGLRTRGYHAHVAAINLFGPRPEDEEE